MLINAASAQQLSDNFITTDIANFWNAYDKISATKDTSEQYKYINTLFIDKGTPGLKGIMKARGYTAKSYIDAINNYPKFWNSVRANTLKANDYAKDIAANVLKLKKLYPELQPANIYFTIGALRTGGTTQGKMILIGSEIAMADKNTVTTEFPKDLDHLRPHFDSEPLKIMAFTNVHEYVHTQQKTTLTNGLLPQCVMEGVAEFVAERATGKESTLPAKTYGIANFEKVRKKFTEQMFNPGNGFWLYSNAANEFGVRDLGYYVGYAICEKYYDKAADKKLAIKQMIELDYNNEGALNNFVDQSGYFTEPVKTLKDKFEASRPTVVNIKPFKNGDNNVNPSTKQITIEFSTIMDKSHRNFELGPLGTSNLLRVKSVIGFSEDGRSLTFEADLLPTHQYQLVIGDGFRNSDGVPLKPYLIDFKTSAN